jgi:hypothetical protein
MDNDKGNTALCQKQNYFSSLNLHSYYIHISQLFKFKCLKILLCDFFCQSVVVRRSDRLREKLQLPPLDMWSVMSCLCKILNQYCMDMYRLYLYMKAKPLFCLKQILIKTPQQMHRIVIELVLPKKIKNILFSLELD